MAQDRHDDTLPLIAGVTETAQSDPGLRLTSIMAGRLPQPNRDRLASTIADLESIFADESDEGTRLRVGAALAMLRKGRRSKDRE